MGDFSIAGRPLREWPKPALGRFLEEYNIGWIVVWSRDARLSFGTLPGVKRLATLPRSTSRPDESAYAVFRVEKPSGFFVLGSGEIAESKPNLLRLKDVRPENGRVVLRYHWLETLATDQEAAVVRHPSPTDPVGFIEIRLDGPVDELTIRNTYRFDARPAKPRR